MTFGANGSVTSGNKLVPTAGTLTNPSQISAGDINASGDVVMSAGSQIQAGTIKVLNGKSLTMTTGVTGNIAVDTIDVSSNQPGVDAGLVNINSRNLNLNIAKSEQYRGRKCR